MKSLVAIAVDWKVIIKCAAGFVAHGICLLLYLLRDEVYMDKVNTLYLAKVNNNSNNPEYISKIQKPKPVHIVMQW